jgi:Uma2 family endonuclease
VSGASRFAPTLAACYLTVMRRSAAASERPKRMGLEEWADLDDDIEGELVDGILEEEEMANFLHEIVVMWFGAVLRGWARRRGGFVGGSEMKLAIAPRRGRKPDLGVFLRGTTPPLLASLIRVAPHVVVEITSPRPRDARRDRVDKLADYARAGVRYYWIVDPQLRSLEVYERGRDGRYTVALSATAGRVRVPGCQGLTLDLDDLWGEVDAAERAHARGARRARRRR